MIIYRAYRTELDPNDRQRSLLLKSAGVTRFAWNWGLRRRIDEYSTTGSSSNAIEQHRQLNAVKKLLYPWMYDVSKCCAQEALRNLDAAYKNFFEHRARFPKFKPRKRGIGSFRLTGAVKIFSDRIQLPRLGRIRLKEKGYLPLERHILSATISERAGHWFVSMCVEEEIIPRPNSGPIAGVDLGITHMATVSDGTVFGNPRALKRHERKLKRLQRSLSRKKKGSKNRGKARLKVAKLHFRITNIRKDALHKATTWLAKTKSVIGVENLNVSGMMKNRHLAKAVSNVGMYEFRRQLEYKAEWYGSRVIVADRFYPSSKTCSMCDSVQEIGLSDRTYACAACGLEIDRDLNAAINLEKVAASSAETLNACGEESAGPPLTGRVELAPVKQEANTKGDVSFG